MAVGSTWTFLSTSASPATYRNSPRSVVCAGPVCHHSGRINADSWPDTTFEAIARRLVCEKCGTRQPNVRPDWAERMPNQANWWDDKVQKGRALAEEINVRSARARELASHREVSRTEFSGLREAPDEFPAPVSGRDFSISKFVA